MKIHNGYEEFDGTIKKSEIDSYVEVCEYCGDLKGERFTCCGENHFKEMILTDWGDYYDLDEVFVIDDMDAPFDADR